LSVISDKDIIIKDPIIINMTNLFMRSKYSIFDLQCHRLKGPFNSRIKPKT